VPRDLALFDLDNTLTHGDTLVPWLVAVAGWPRFAVAGLGATFQRVAAPAGADRRTVFKEALQIPLLRGVTKAEGLRRAEAVAPDLRWKREAPAALERLRAAGAQIVVATGAARVAAEIFVRHRFGEGILVLGTELETVDGCFTGRLAGGNCVREEKARRVSAWIEANGPFGERWGYGNAPHDLPMLALVDHATVV
jgi:phosphatidylglycerophosphatase C